MPSLFILHLTVAVFACSVFRYNHGVGAFEVEGMNTVGEDPIRLFTSS